MNRAMAVLVSVMLLTAPVLAADVKIYDDGELALWGREDPSGVAEPAVKTYYGGAPQGRFKVLEAYDRVPGQFSWPLTVADLVANTYLRPTYQVADGTSGSLGTSVVGTVLYRTASGLQYIPSISQAEVFIDGTDRLRTILSGQFGSDASVRSTRTFSDPPIGSTVTGLTVRFETQNAIPLDAALLGDDAMRLVDMTSMFADHSQYDADVLRWLAPDGTVHTLQLTDATPRDAHLFSSPMEIAVGGYFELIKEPGSTWYSTSPSIRISLESMTGLTGRVGIQGWLAATTDPTADSLGVWLEWMDVPTTIPSGVTYEMSYSVTATPPSVVPEPATVALLAAGVALSARRAHARGRR